jgi:nucleobase:cation symporter-1, NCS1 family
MRLLAGMICYFIFWIIQFPFLLISPQKIRWLFMIKAILVPAAWFSMLIWAIAKTDGAKPIFQQKSTLHGSALGYAWLAALNSALGNYATLSVNIPDFTVSISPSRLESAL